MPHPSNGCLTCRRRRIGCDRRLNGCANCERYNTVCPGYPDAFDVVHRHQAGPAAGGTWRAAETQRHVASVPSLSFSADLLPEREAFVLSVYYASFCVEGTSRWPIEQLRTQGNGCLLAAVRVMGFTAITKKWLVVNASTLLPSFYATATRLLNEALASETECVKDSTLLSTILMGAIETRACSNDSTSVWEAHTRGAAALLSLRQPTQVTNPAGSLMFFQTSFQIFTSSLLGKCSIPTTFIELSRSVETYVVDKAYPLWRWHWVMIRFVDFMAGIPENIEDTVFSLDSLQLLANQAIAIYDSMLEIFNEASATWQYTLVQCLDFAEITEYAHVYYSVTASQMWNGHRTATIKLIELLQKLARHATSAGSSINDQYSSASLTQAINQAAQESIRAAPQTLAVVKIQLRQELPNNEFKICDDANVSSSGCFIQMQPSDERLPLLQGCLLQWSLFFAAQCELIEVETRQSILRILDIVGTTMHVQQWKLLADRLRPNLS